MTVEELVEAWKAGIPPQLRKRNTMEPRGFEEVARQAKAKRDAVAPEIAAMYARGLSIAAVGRKFKMSQNTVRRTLVENGIEIDSGKGRK